MTKLFLIAVAVCVIIVASFTTTLAAGAGLSDRVADTQSTATIRQRWSTSCSFSTADNASDVSATALPLMQLITDNYAARSESRAVIDIKPLPWRFTAARTIVPVASLPAANDGVQCLGRLTWRGEVPPFYLRSVLSEDNDQYQTMRRLAELRPVDLDVFANCETYKERFNTNPVRISVRNLRVTGGAWSTTSSATVPANSRCNLASGDLSQFVRVFAETSLGAEELLASPTTHNGGIGGASHADRDIQWIARSMHGACPFYIGVVLDPAICPATVTFTGTPLVSLDITVSVGVESTLVWYMYAPAFISIGCGVLFLVLGLVFLPRNEALPESPTPDETQPSILLALAKLFLVTSCVITAITLALVLIIDRHEDILRQTSDAVILTGSLFAASGVCVVAMGAMLAGREHPRLKSMGSFVVAWLRLLSRALGLGATCAAWYRGFLVIAVLYVVFQFIIEVSFWSNLATTFSGSHEPLRYGVPGDQMLVCSDICIAGLYFPGVGVFASAASRVFCTLEMSERFMIRQKETAPEPAAAAAATATVDPGDPDAPQHAGEAAGAAAPGGGGAEKGVEMMRRAADGTVQPYGDDEDQQQAAGGGAHAGDDVHAARRGAQRGGGGAASSAVAAAGPGGNNTADEGGAGEQQQQQPAADEEEEQEAEDGDEVHIPHSVFSVKSTATFAAVFEGIMTVRWWCLVFEVLGLSSLTCVIARAHPPFVPYAMMHLVFALGHFGAGFGALAGGKSFGSVGLGDVCSGDPRATAEAVTECSLSKAPTELDSDDDDEGENAEARALKSTTNINENDDDEKIENQNSYSNNNGKNPGKRTPPPGSYRIDHRHDNNNDDNNNAAYSSNPRSTSAGRAAYDPHLRAQAQSNWQRANNKVRAARNLAQGSPHFQQRSHENYNNNDNNATAAASAGFSTSTYLDDFNRRRQQQQQQREQQQQQQQREREQREHYQFNSRPVPSQQQLQRGGLNMTPSALSSGRGGGDVDWTSTQDRIAFLQSRNRMSVYEGE